MIQLLSWRWSPWVGWPFYLGEIIFKNMIGFGGSFSGVKALTGGSFYKFYESVVGASHHTNVCKIWWLRQAISLFFFNISLLNLPFDYFLGSLFLSGHVRVYWVTSNLYFKAVYHQVPSFLWHNRILPNDNCSYIESLAKVLLNLSFLELEPLYFYFPASLLAVSHYFLPPSHSL